MRLCLKQISLKLRFLSSSLCSNCPRHPNIRRTRILIWHNWIRIVVRVEENRLCRFRELMRMFAAARLLVPRGPGMRTATGAPPVRAVTPVGRRRGHCLACTLHVFLVRSFSLPFYGAFVLKWARLQSLHLYGWTRGFSSPAKTLFIKFQCKNKCLRSYNFQILFLGNNLRLYLCSSKDICQQPE
jgi:hypothetical protein